MTQRRSLSLFVSSRMAELKAERQAAKDALAMLGIRAWVWEDHAGSRPESIQQTYLKEVERSHIYLGLFWKGYGKYPIEEYEHALTHKKPCFIYEKRSELEARDEELQNFLDQISRVETGLTIGWFETADQLAEMLMKDIVGWLVENQGLDIQGIAPPRHRAAHYVARGPVTNRLRRALQEQGQAAIVGVQGMGGLGKTELAIELADEIEAGEAGRAVGVNAADRPPSAVYQMRKFAMRNRRVRHPFSFLPGEMLLKIYPSGRRRQSNMALISYA